MQAGALFVCMFLLLFCMLAVVIENIDTSFWDTSGQILEIWHDHEIAFS